MNVRQVLTDFPVIPSSALIILCSSHTDLWLRASL